MSKGLSSPLDRSLVWCLLKLATDVVCLSLFNSFAPACIAKKNVRKVAERKTVIICHN